MNIFFIYYGHNYIHLLFFFQDHHSLSVYIFHMNYLDVCFYLD